MALALILFTARGKCEHTMNSQEPRLCWFVAVFIVLIVDIVSINKL